MPRRAIVAENARPAMGLLDVLLRLDPADGNDPIEASAKLPVVPAKGTTIEVWVPGAVGGFAHSHPEYLEVVDVTLCTWAPERIEVWVRHDGYDLDEARRIFAAIDANEQP